MYQIDHTVCHQQTPDCDNNKIAKIVPLEYSFKRIKIPKVSKVSEVLIIIKSIISSSNKNMNKKKVNKFTYHFFNFLFLSLCLSGLIWQITQISINFFRYEVIKNINIIMPEEIPFWEEVMNICFKNTEILDHEKCISLAQSKKGDAEDYITICDDQNPYIAKFNFEERFNMTLNISNSGFKPIMDFIQGDKYCYQNIKSNPHRCICNSFLSNVTIIQISIGAMLPIFDQNRLQKIDRIFPMGKKSARIGASSYFYNITRLRSPYVDHCIPYQDIGYADRNDALYRCENEKVEQSGGVSNSSIIARSDIDSYKNLTYGFPVDLKYCQEVWKYFACNQIIYQTRINLDKDIENPQGLCLGFDENKGVSTKMVSQPRIDNIDYVTYILGALGSWIGFSFIGINPIPWILKYHDGPSIDSAARTQVAPSVRSRVQDLEITRLKKISTNHERNIAIARNERQKLELICHRMQEHIDKLTREAHPSNQEIIRCNERINALVS